MRFSRPFNIIAVSRYVKRLRGVAAHRIAVTADCDRSCLPLQREIITIAGNDNIFAHHRDRTYLPIAANSDVLTRRGQSRWHNSDG